jgi:hypothetical protein
MRKVVLLLLVLTALGVMSGIASAANGTIWPPISIGSYSPVRR